MNMQMLVQQMDDSFNRLKSIHQTAEQCDQLMAMSRSLIEKIQERDRIITQLRSELAAIKRSQ
jgi:hypothetical protein